MSPRPRFDPPEYRGSGKLKDKAALITGGDSGIGRAVAILFAREGADVAITYLNEHSDANETKRLVEAEGRKCLLFPGDIGWEATCQKIVEDTVREFGRLDVLVNNAAEQHPQGSIENISREQLERTFRTNIFAQFFLRQSSPQTFQTWIRDYQHHLSDSISRQRSSAGLFLDQRSNCRLHSFVV